VTKAAKKIAKLFSPQTKHDTLALSSTPHFPQLAWQSGLLPFFLEIPVF